MNKVNLETLLRLVSNKLNEHNIPWWLEGGSLLGCYREGRIIAWDDDIDIGFPLAYEIEVFRALSELDGFFVNWNLYFNLCEINTYNRGDVRGLMCLKPHIIEKSGVYEVFSLPKKYLLRGVPGHMIAFCLTLLIRKLPKKFQEMLIKVNMKLNIKVRYRGSVEEYQTIIQTYMNKILVNIPIGARSILERHYGRNFMTPTKKEDYDHEDKGLI